MTPEASRAGEQAGSVPTIELELNALTLEFGSMSFSWIEAHVLFAFDVLQALFGIYFKVSSFVVKALFCMQVLIWHFGLLLGSDCFNESWLRHL